MKKFKLHTTLAIVAICLLFTVACTNNSEKAMSNKLDSLKILTEKRNIAEHFFVNISIEFENIYERIEILNHHINS